MIKKMLNFFLKLMSKYLPHPFTIAWGMSLFVAAIAMILTHATPIKIVQYWGEGFWALLSFAMQMSLLIISGYALATSNFVIKGLKKLVRIPKTPKQTILFVSFISMGLYFVNWGLGLIAGGLLAREAAKVHKDTDFRLLVTAAFSGIMILHGGLSASVPLLINTPGHFAEKQIGLVPFTQTIFGTQNLFILITLVIVIPFFCLLMLPKKGEEVFADPTIFEEDDLEVVPVNTENLSIGDKIDRSKILNFTLWGSGLAYIIFYFYTKGFSLNINIINLIFIVLGLALHGSLIKYTQAFTKGCTAAGGVILQFPFYAGIMGIMTGSGLVTLVSHWLISVATPGTFELYCYFSSLIISMFVPSGGGHWAIQAPFMIPPALALGVPAWKVAMGVAWGEGVWNIVCPMWALPVLAIAKLKLSDLIGFSVLLFVIGNIVVITGIMLFQ